MHLGATVRSVEPRKSVTGNALPSSSVRPPAEVQPTSSTGTRRFALVCLLSYFARIRCVLGKYTDKWFGQHVHRWSWPYFCHQRRKCLLKTSAHYHASVLEAVPGFHYVISRAPCQEIAWDLLIIQGCRGRSPLPGRGAAGPPA